MADPGFPRQGWDGGALTPEFGPKPIITARKRSLGQGNIFAPVCHFVQRGSTWAGTPQDQVHPRDQVHPLPVIREQCMLGDTGNKWAVRILLECILVHSYYYRLQ